MIKNYDHKMYTNGIKEVVRSSKKLLTPEIKTNEYEFSKNVILKTLAVLEERLK